MNINFGIGLILLVISTIMDIRKRTIKNIIPLIGIILGLIMSILFSEVSIFESIIVTVIYFLLLFCLPRMLGAAEFIGAGDIKLYMAVSFLMGWKFSFYTLIFSLLIGTVFLIIINFKRIKNIVFNVLLFFNSNKESKNIIKNEIEKQETNAFAPYILLGYITTFIYTYLGYDFIQIIINNILKR